MYDEVMTWRVVWWVIVAELGSTGQNEATPRMVESESSDHLCRPEASGPVSPSLVLDAQHQY
jgi:hypothetical protein